MDRGGIYRYCIGGQCVHIVVDAACCDLPAVLPSLAPFASDDAATAPMFVMTITTCEPPACDWREIGDFDTGNGHTRVEKDDTTGDYRFLMRNIAEQPVARMWTRQGFTHCYCKLLAITTVDATFALNTALMMAYAFEGAHHDTLLIHASCATIGDWAYAFIARSGTGKSTHVANWLKHVPDATLLNDDNPVVRVIDGEVYIYGSPWSGKTPCYLNERKRLGAITRIERAPSNRIVREPVAAAFASLLPSCSTMKWDKAIYDDLIKTITNVVASTGIYTMYCLPDREAAEICSTTIAQCK